MPRQGYLCTIARKAKIITSISRSLIHITEYAFLSITTRSNTASYSG